jgi:TRAP-type C4-dicarboxylate transport system permease small subunit
MTAMTSETGQTGETGRKGILDRLEQAALVFAAVTLVAVVTVQAWQVFARYVLNDSPSWTEPMALVFIGNTAMLGAAVGVRRETHFSFPLLADSAPWPVRQACRAVARLAMLALGAGLAWFGFILMVDASGVAMAGAPLPVGLRFAPVAWGGALIALFALERLIRGLAEKREDAAPAAVQAEMA